MILPNITGGFMLQTMLYLAAQHNNNTLSELYHVPPGLDPADVGETKCYGVYGCFPITEPWFAENRPFQMYPLSPSVMEVRFPVFNKNRRIVPKFIDINDPEKVHSVGIHPQGSIYFISHGYLEAGDRPWVQDMVNALLDQDLQGTASVIVIDWGHKGASSPPYVQAVANTRLVGAITAHIIHLIYEELGMSSLDKVHLIGHSLGSHICGYAGHTLQKDFNLIAGRISGLDPAEPFFKDVDPLVRLDQTDAKFVDVYHTDAKSFVRGGLGIQEAIGHVDFYPNGGFDNPGCGQGMNDYIEQERGSFFLGVRQFVSCNHLRAYEFFTESVQPSCPFLAIGCDSYEDFKEGKCFKCDHEHPCLQYGFGSYNSYKRLLNNDWIREDSAPIKTYLMTNARPPYCRTHYKITIKISDSEDSRLHGGEIGTMSIIIKSHLDLETERLTISQQSVHYEVGKNYTSVISGKDVGIPQYVEVNLDYEVNLLNILTWRIVETPRVYIEYVVVESLEHKSSLKLCPAFQTPVVARSPLTFRNEHCH